MKSRLTENNGHGQGWGHEFEFKARRDRGDWGMAQRGLGDGICHIYYVKTDDLVGDNRGS